VNDRPGRVTVSDSETECFIFLDDDHPVDLPPEIWLRIAPYLRSPTLLGLYFVNGIFFDLAMNERYHVNTYTITLVGTSFE
jgi:hypothetical protein